MSREVVCENISFYIYVVKSKMFRHARLTVGVITEVPYGIHEVDVTC